MLFMYLIVNILADAAAWGSGEGGSWWGGKIYSVPQHIISVEVAVFLLMKKVES